ncbi:hypothetical protein [Methylibium sp.]|uniref:hypothetical protein n=1 Tax=Methylibium sp. TaxID=2067992 RepID=UPI003D104BEB
MAQALTLVAASGAPPGAQMAAVLISASLGGAALLWVACERRFERLPVAAVLGLALVLRLIAAQASPLLEDDHYRYLWDGMRTATTLDPYRLPPAAFFGQVDLAAHWQDILGGINNPDIPTIYGPVLQWLFALAHWISPGRLGALQALLLVADMAVLWVLMGQGMATRWLLAYALHPLVLKEAIASAHPDGLVALALLLVLTAWRQRAAARVGVMLGLAVGTKIAALVVLPLLLLAPAKQQSAAAPVAAAARWAFRLGLGFCATLAVLYAPFILNGGSDASALGIFGSRWRFNPLLYRAVEVLVPAAAARTLAAALIVAGIAVLCWQWQRQARCAAACGSTCPLPPVDLALVLLLLFSPVVNPWYWLWALPLSTFFGRGWVVAGSVMAAVSYLNSTVLFEAGVWAAHGTVAAPYSVPWPLAAFQMAVLFGAFAAVRARSKALARVRAARSGACPSSFETKGRPS